MAILKPDQESKVTVGVSVGSNTFMILQVIFHTDGSVFINFPYYKHSNGLLAVATHPGGDRQRTFSLEPGGKVVSHLVKYSHKPDGEVHFSQDGKVLTVIRKKSVPLVSLAGHLFSVSIQGIDNFDRNNPSSKKRRFLRVFDAGSEMPEAIRIVGYWHPLGNLKDVVPDGVPMGAMLLSPPLGNPMEKYVLLLEGKPVSKLTQDEPTAMILIGGFDGTDIIQNPELETKFLAFSYPLSDYDQLKARLGSADYEAGRPR